MKSVHNVSGDTSLVSQAQAVQMTCAGNIQKAHLSTPDSRPNAYGRSLGTYRGPNLPADITVAEIEMHLDRVALAIDESPHGQEYLPLFDWLEDQLARKRSYLATMGAIQARVRRLRDRTEAPS